MEIAVNHQPLFAGPLQHPLLQGAMIYPGESSAWQPVVTSLPPQLTEVPKESIIAHTDFTTTSGLAKRRLSSKKRKKQEANRLSCDSTLSDGGSRSPNDSAYGSCQSVSSATCTPPGHDRMNETGQHPQLMPTSTSSTLTHPTPLTHSTSSSFHPLVVQRPPTHPQTSEQQNPGNLPPQGTLAQNQYSNPAMLSQLQQELNYRFLSNGRQPHPSADRTHSQDGPSRKPSVKWCSAHISVAKMIQQSQLEAQLQSQPQMGVATTAESQPHAQPMDQAYSTSQTEALTAQQQQQLALLQMYGVHPTMSTGVQPAGYMAVPYSTMHEVPLVQFAAVPQASSNLAMLKPGEAVMSMPTHPLQMAASGAVPQYAHTQNVPLTVNSTGGLLMQGGGSWVAPVPMVGGSCIINPLQAGILAAPWVK